MEQWYRKSLGQGALIYQGLRELRDLRYTEDRDVAIDQLYVVLVEVATTFAYVYFPPGNDRFSALCGASACLPAAVQDGEYFELSVEEYPILPGFPSDMLREANSNDGC